MAVGVVIFLNALNIGFEEEFGDEYPTLFAVFENLFAIFFVIELGMRFYVEPGFNGAGDSMFEPDIQ